MDALSSLTSASNNINSLIARLMTLERKPIYNLEYKKSALIEKKQIYSDLKSKIIVLKSKATELSQTVSDSIFKSKTAESSDTKYLTAIASSSAQNASYNISIVNLAKAHTVISNLYNNSETTISDSWAGNRQFSITVNGNIHNITVAVNSGDSNETVLNNIVNEINSLASNDATASIIHPVGGSSRLNLVSDKTGTTYKMSITDTDGLLSFINITNSALATDNTGGYIYADLGGHELDSRFILNGITMYRDSNTVSDAITGLTLQLLAITSNDVTLSVNTDISTIKSKIEGFLGDYNNLINYIADKSKINNESKERGPLSGEYTYNNLRRTLRNYMVSEVAEVISGNPKMLSEIGITPDTNGNMSISNESKFNDAAASNIQKVSDLFNLSGGVAEKIKNLLENYVIYGGIVDDNKSYIDIKVGGIERQITRLEERLSRKEVYYRRQFAMMQDMLSAISTQQSITEKFLGSYSNLNMLV